MANKEISELSAITNTASGDFFLVIDSEDDNKIKKIAVNDAIKVTSDNIFQRFVFNNQFPAYSSGDFNVVKNTTDTPSATIVLNQNGFDAFHNPVVVASNFLVDCFRVNVASAESYEKILFSGLGEVNTSGSGGSVNFSFKQVENSGTLVDVVMNNGDFGALPDQSATGTLTGIQIKQITEFAESGSAYYSFVKEVNQTIPVGPFTFTVFLDNVQS
jgi:hypothetical protein